MIINTEIEYLKRATARKDHAKTRWQLSQLRLGNWLRMRREKADMSLRAMAKAIGISASFLSDLELAKRPWSEARVKQYLKVLDNA